MSFLYTHTYNARMNISLMNLHQRGVTALLTARTAARSAAATPCKENSNAVWPVKTCKCHNYTHFNNLLCTHSCIEHIEGFHCNSRVCNVLFYIGNFHFTTEISTLSSILVFCKTPQ